MGALARSIYFRFEMSEKILVVVKGTIVRMIENYLLQFINVT